MKGIMPNVERKAGYEQVCIWPGCAVQGASHPMTPAEFEGAMLLNLNVRVQYLEEIRTAADQDEHGRTLEGTGGRTDLFFAIHHEDIGRFALARLPYHIRWVEDAMSPSNHSYYLYPSRVYKYCTWGDAKEVVVDADREAV
jgi:hypothetical protein